MVRKVCLAFPRLVFVEEVHDQIEAAYGSNNAILDNCHVRVAFSTNDERTARRISDSLGTATELRAMKNYAGTCSCRHLGAPHGEAVGRDARRYWRELGVLVGGISMPPEPAAGGPTYPRLG
jgi:hypothetical protein